LQAIAWQRHAKEANGPNLRLVRDADHTVTVLERLLQIPRARVLGERDGNIRRKAAPKRSRPFSTVREFFGAKLRNSAIGGANCLGLYQPWKTDCPKSSAEIVRQL